MTPYGFEYNSKYGRENCSYWNHVDNNSLDSVMKELIDFSSGIYANHNSILVAHANRNKR